MNLNILKTTLAFNSNVNRKITTRTLVFENSNQQLELAYIIFSFSLQDAWKINSLNN